MNTQLIHRTVAAATTAAAIGLTALAMPAGAATPTNDNFAQRELISGASGTVAGSTVDATAEPGDPIFASHSVWYTWTAPLSGLFSFATDIDFTAFPQGDTYLGVFTGDSLGTLVDIDDNDDFGDSFESRVTFEAVENTEYAIVVGGFPNATGGVADFVLDWQLVNDTTPPETTMQVTSSSRNQVTFALDFTDDFSNNAVRFNISMDGVPVETTFLQNFTMTVPGGPHTFSAVATDEAGNTDPTPAVAELRVRGPRRV